ncbi:MAG TPA: hypothetical protein EYG85_04965 [Crocinitomix sp.]|nr:hypothetical protein [Crocinitomix sp.]
MKIITVFLFFVLVLSCKEQINITESDVKKNNLALPSDVIENLQNGDIILRKGAGPLSAHLMLNTKEEYTHCGILFNDNGIWKAIHTIGGEISDNEIDGIQTITLDGFVSPTADSTLFICRPIFTNNAGEKVYKKALEYLDRSVPFDHRFSLLTTDKLYCSELLYHIFKDVNDGKNIFDIKKKHKSYMLMFSTFFKTKNFKPVYDMREDK